MIEFDGVVDLDKKDMLPDGPGIYFVCDSDGNVLYVGKSVNIHNRWLSHHRYNQAKSIEKVVIKWKQCDITDLKLKEVYFIETLTPEWNGTLIPPTTKAPREIKPGIQLVTIKFEDTDREGLEVIKAHYGIKTNSDVVRMLIREKAREIASMGKGKDNGN